jgi:hypothetical protein
MAQQLPTESASKFCSRVGGHFHRFNQLPTARSGGEEERTAVSDAITVVQDAAATGPQLATVTRTLDAYFLAGLRQGRSTVIESIQNRIIIDGLTDPEIKLAAKQAELGGATFAVLQDAIARAEKPQAAKLELADAGYTNSTARRPLKTSAVDTETAKEADPGVATFNNKGMGKGKQEPVPKPQLSTAGNQRKKNKKRTNFSKPPTTSCWECHQMGHRSRRCPVKARMMAQFMQQNGGAGAMPLHQMPVGPDNKQWSGNASAGWM